jgi:tetratricopeptide (TPR) repeat protein
MKLSALTMAIVLLAGPAVAVADDLEDAVQNIKDAAAKKDAPLVKSLAGKIYPMTSAILAETAPTDADEKKIFDERVKYAKSAQAFVESALAGTAIGSTPEVTVELLSLLEQQNPKSKYLDAAYGNYLVAMDKTGAKARIPAMAEKALANFPENDDLLMLAMENAVAKKQTDRALVYANRLTSAINKHGKPEGVPAADWDRKKNAELSRGYYMAGVISAEKGQYLPADKNLRAALPLIKDQPTMMGPALFYLGMTNYQLAKMTLNKAKMLEAVKFSEQAMAIDSPYADQARHNALVMKDEAAKMR